MDRFRLPGEPVTDGPTALRPWRDRDIPAIVKACQDPEIHRWTRVPSPYGERDAMAWLLQRHEKIHVGALAPLAIVSAADVSILLGSISLIRISWEHARAEVGYWLAPEARGQGHTTRAVRLICTWAFGELGLHRIELLAATANLSSQRVAERAGFTREALLRSYMCGRNGREDFVIYSLLAGEAS